MLSAQSVHTWSWLSPISRGQYFIKNREKIPDKWDHQWTFSNSANIIKKNVSFLGIKKSNHSFTEFLGDCSDLSFLSPASDTIFTPAVFLRYVPWAQNGAVMAWHYWWVWPMTGLGWDNAGHIRMPPLSLIPLHAITHCHSPHWRHWHNPFSRPHSHTWTMRSYLELEVSGKTEAACA